jgi:hypothetical protein
MVAIKHAASCHSIVVPTEPDHGAAQIRAMLLSEMLGAVPGFLRRCRNRFFPAACQRCRTYLLDWV